MDKDVSPMFAPVVALIIWTLILQLWKNANCPIKRKGKRVPSRVGAKPGIAGDVVEDHEGWNAHHPDHLMEQPAIFYALAISMALLHTHGSSVTNVIFAWAYVFLRIAHTLAQVTSTPILHRFVLLNLAPIALLGLAIHLAIHVL